jgi:hypothetical protein
MALGLEIAMSSLNYRDSAPHSNIGVTTQHNGIPGCREENCLGHVKQKAAVGFDALI